MKQKKKKEKREEVKEKQEITGGAKPAGADKGENFKLKKKKKDGKHIRMKNICCMGFVFLSTAAVSYGGCRYLQLDLYYTVRNLCLCMTAALAVIFSYQAGRLTGSFSYDDGEHPGRFLLLYLCGVVCAVIFISLPVTGWMFLFFYIALARVSDSVTGACAGTSLLILSAVLCQQVSLSAFLVYFFSGMVGIVLFAHQEGEFHIAVPLGLSLGVQLLLIFSGELLIQNKKLTLESALAPLANTVINGILLCIFLQYYVNKVARKVQNLYLMVNDPEYAAMTALREKSEEEYYHAVHTAYLTERIAGELGLDVMAAKCAAYYCHLSAGEQENYPFPEHAAGLLSQLREKGKLLKEKEAVVVFVCDELITEIQRLKAGEVPQKQGKGQIEGQTETKGHGKDTAKDADAAARRGDGTDYGQLISRLFAEQFTIEAFAETDITLSNLRYIQRRLMEEKMYYEFIIK